MFKSRSEGNVVYKCTIQLFQDDSILEAEFQPQHKGEFLLEFVCETLDITEKDYFGLRFVDNFKQRHWLDLSKSIIKQVKDVEPLVLSFRVKFYPADPTRLTLNGKCMLYQQLKRDLRHGRLFCSTVSESAHLGALIAQEELGDFTVDCDYSSLKLALRQTDQLEKKVMELHKKKIGLDISSIYDEFISISRSLETYGIDPYPVKDCRGTQSMYIGINFSGISSYSLGKRVQHFRWPEVTKLNFEGKMFIIHLSYTIDREVKKHTFGFKCASGQMCRFVWRCAIEQMLFFTLPNGQNAPNFSGGSFFSFGAKFRYTGRTEREIMSESLQSLKQQHSTESSPNKRKASSVPATPQGELSDLRMSRSIMSEPMGSSFIDHDIYNNGIHLETLSEENRKISGEMHDHLFEIDSNNRLGYHLSDTMAMSLPTTAINNDTNNLVNQQNIANMNMAKSIKKFSLIHTFVPSFIIVIFSIGIFCIIVLESEFELLSNVKNWPEMISLRYHYYQPLKEFIAKKFGALF